MQRVLTRGQYQYLYCDNSHPHQLTGLYAIGATAPTCTNQTGQGYASTYDHWGNVTGRTYNGTTAALSYNNLNQLMEWNAGSTNQEWYLYDTSGNRVLRRSTNSSSTTLTVYPFGLEEHLYSGTGTNQSNTYYYYFLAGRLIRDLNANGTYFLLTNVLGSILSDISWSTGEPPSRATRTLRPKRKHDRMKRKSQSERGARRNIAVEYIQENIRHYRMSMCDCTRGNDDILVSRDTRMRHAPYEHDRHPGDTRTWLEREAALDTGGPAAQ